MRTSLRNVKQDLADVSNHSVNDINMNRLASLYNNEVESRKKADLESESTIKLNLPQIDRVRKIISKELERQTDQINSKLPVSSVFDALQIVKANKNINKDVGLRAFAGHLETIWNKNRSANITAKSYLEMKDHYTRNYPRSVVGEVIDNIGKQGYLTLPMADLINIASQIENQDDYNKLIMKYGLQGTKPNQVKARRFILAIVNRNSD